jgi:tetratricopeptide (TPR) repeat protein
VLRATAAQARIGDPQQEADARRFFEQALELDPDYPRAHAGLAIVLLCEWVRESGDGDETLDAALEHASRAVAIDGEDYECREALGWILLHCKSYELSEQHYRRAIELNPNSPAELAAMGAACAFLGRAAEGIDWFQLARRIDPFFDATWYWHLLGVACFTARRYDEALAALERPADTPLWVRCYMAASHAHAGRAEAARAIAAAIARDAPCFRGEDLVRKEPYRNPDDLAHFADGLKKAGLLKGRTRDSDLRAPAMGRAPTFGFRATTGRLPRPV